jgi:hypothetical protein
MNGLVDDMKAPAVKVLFKQLDDYPADRFRNNLCNMKKYHASGKLKCDEGKIPSNILKILKSGNLPRGKRSAGDAAGLADAAESKSAGLCQLRCCCLY